MASQVTSFQKKMKSKVPYIPGSKPSIRNAQLLVSSGVPSFDYIVGGGLAVGTVLLIEEDKYGNYSKLLLKYFLAEGIVSGHALMVASQDVNTEQLMEELPAPVQNDTDAGAMSGPEDKMTIAWRYQNLRAVQSTPAGIQFGHYYDLSGTMDKDVLKEANIFHWNSAKDIRELDPFSNPVYHHLLETLQHQLEEGGYCVTATPEKRNILRVAIHSLGSPLWADPSGCAEKFKGDLCLFFYCLRSLLRSAYAVCMVTLPSHLLQDLSVVKRCEHLCDTSVRLESFAGSDKETNPVFKDYHGLFHLNKLPAINTFAAHVPESYDLAFKLRRKKFVIEKLHLPPELQETTQREQDDILEAFSGVTRHNKSSRHSTDLTKTAKQKDKLSEVRRTGGMGCGDRMGPSLLDF